jgi:hypothetical protein
MRFRIVLRTAFDKTESLGLHDSRVDAIEHLRLWWQSNDVTDSHWLVGFLSLAIENDEAEEWGGPGVGEQP